MSERNEDLNQLFSRTNLCVSCIVMMYRFLLNSITTLSLVFGVTLKPNVSIGALFEPENYEHFNKIFNKALREQELTGLLQTRVQGTAIAIKPIISEYIEKFCTYVHNYDIATIMVIGSERTIHTLNVIAQPLGIPVLGYMTGTKAINAQVHNPFYLRLQPSKADHARAYIQFFQANFWFNVVLLLEEELLFDGFYSEMMRTSKDSKWNLQVEIIAGNISTENLYNMILTRLAGSPKLVFIHSNMDLCKRIFFVSKKENISSVNHAWFITENCYTRNSSELVAFPSGVLAILPRSVMHIEDIITDGVNLLVKAVQGVERYVDLSKRKQCFERDLDSNQEIGEQLHRRILGTSVPGITGPIQFDHDGTLNAQSFDIQNFVKEGSLFWRDIGYIRRNDISPFGIIWPGDTITEHMISGKKKYRIVTNPVKPFVMEQPPNADYEGCAQDTTCLFLEDNPDKMATIQMIKDFEDGVFNESRPYEIRCCRGLSIDLLNRLASDLDFEYTLYIASDKTYGKELNGTWNGMVRDLMTGTAHMAVAAMSITPSRVKVIDFTDPYFFSGFSVLYTEIKIATNMIAFLEPFSIEVWFAIFISATFAALGMGLFEWNSPFGLNPWGRKRKTNYCLASGLTMVYSVLFGHTVKTKSPKAWPSKVLQNFWAFSCIFIIASYTANLAAFIAGKHAGVTYGDIYDSRLLDIRVGVLPGSAVEGFVRKLNSRLYVSSQTHLVESSDIAINQLIEGKLDAYLGDYPILDYARAKLDPDCDLRLLSQTFGEDGYGIGLPKGSPLKTSLSKRIQQYHASGYIEDLIDVHFADAQCYKQRIKQEDSQLEVQHHAGLFVMLCAGIILAIIFLLVEHAVYKWLVPYFRKTPANSCWKSTHVMFFSQRLHRIITSSELIAAYDSAKELLGLVRNRDFAKMFQKNTIRTNKLADMAKKKRLNRNFLSVVEKAKWVREMEQNNLFGDDDTPASPTAHITEVDLKDLGSDIDVKILQSLHAPEGHTFSFESSFVGNSPPNKQIAHQPQEDTKNMVSKHLLLSGKSKDPGSAYVFSSVESKTNSTRETRAVDIDVENNFETNPLEIDSYATNSDYVDIPGSHKKYEFYLPHDGGQDYGVISESGGSSENGRFTKDRRLPNGYISNRESVYRANQNQLDTFAQDIGNITNRRCSGSLQPSRRKDRLDKRKHQSLYNSQVRREYNQNIDINIDNFSKEDLLLMWKASELELNRRLERAIKDKSKLERKLAQLDVHTSTPV